MFALTCAVVAVMLTLIALLVDSAYYESDIRHDKHTGQSTFNEKHPHSCERIERVIHNKECPHECNGSLTPPKNNYPEHCKEDLLHVLPDCPTPCQYVQLQCQMWFTNEALEECFIHYKRKNTRMWQLALLAITICVCSFSYYKS